MTGQRALLVAEPAAQQFAREIADSLESLGLSVAVRGFDAAADIHETADIVILGASVTTFRSSAGDALRGWLMANRPAHPGQYAAAFDLHRCRVTRPRESTSVRALRTMSTRGFRLASRPISFGVTADRGTPAAGETARAHAWACELAERSTDRAAHRYALVGSGQGH